MCPSRNPDNRKADVKVRTLGVEEVGKCVYFDFLSVCKFTFVGTFLDRRGAEF